MKTNEMSLIEERLVGTRRDLEIQNTELVQLPQMTQYLRNKASGSPLTRTRDDNAALKPAFLE